MVSGERSASASWSPNRSGTLSKRMNGSASGSAQGAKSRRTAPIAPERIDLSGGWGRFGGGGSGRRDAMSVGIYSDS